jgi:hypothetical protein
VARRSCNDDAHGDLRSIERDLPHGAH